MRETKEKNRFIALPLEVIRDRRLNKTHLRVLMCMFSHYNMRTKQDIHLKVSTMCSELGLADNKVRQAIKELYEMGWLLKYGTGGRSRPNRYTLNWDWHESELAKLGYTLPNSGRLSKTRKRGHKPSPIRDVNPPRLGEGHRTELEQKGAANQKRGFVGSGVSLSEKVWMGVA